MADTGGPITYDAWLFVCLLAKRHGLLLTRYRLQ